MLYVSVDVLQVLSPSLSQTGDSRLKFLHVAMKYEWLSVLALSELKW